MKVLITGNLGYIGPSVVKQLRKSYPNVEIIGYDIGYFARFITNELVSPDTDVDIQYYGDVRQFPENILEGVDAVIQLAAISNDPIGNKFEAPTLDINYQSTIDIATKAKKKGVKSFVFASSCSVYGFAEETPRTEQSEVGPITAYAKSKVMSEKGLEVLADNSFKITCLRFATACGMSDRLRLDLVLNDFVASAIATGGITILSDGSPWRPLINIKDMARAMDWAIQRDAKTTGGNYLVINAGSNENNFRVRDLAEAVKTVMPDVEININKDAQPDKRSYKVDFSMFKNFAPNHQPQTDLVASIKELKRGMEVIKFDDKEFRKSHLIRLNVINELMEKGKLDNNLKVVK
jgi:nucleoside-diphosphate-sugar epimerase